MKGGTMAFFRMLDIMTHVRKHGSFTQMLNKCPHCPADHTYLVCMCGKAWPVKDPGKVIEIISEARKAMFKAAANARSRSGLHRFFCPTCKLAIWLGRSFRV